jgi:aldehyde:ferredoxin oxidoreductase
VQQRRHGGAAIPGPGQEGSAGYVIDSQHTRPLFDALGVCRLQLMELGFEVENYAELFYFITGKKRSWEEMLGVSERIWNLTRSISAREIDGFGRSWDYPPKRFSTEPVTTGPNEGYLIPRRSWNSCWTGITRPGAGMPTACPPKQP